MIKFHNAINENGKIINISDVTQENRAKHYTCVGCGKEMSAVLGQVKEHHFRHKGDSCSWESYLHSLGRKLIKEKFDNQKEFLIKYNVEYLCDKVNNCQLVKIVDKKCNRKELFIQDLKKIYNICEEEKNYKGYRADLMLSNKNNPNIPPIFLEIAVTHDCEQNKIESGIPIIEIKLGDENVLQDIMKTVYISDIDNTAIHFYNIAHQFNSIIPLDRFCITKNDDILRGYLIENGQDGLNCRNVTDSGNHRQNSIYEIAIPSGIKLNGDTINTYMFGLIKAFHKGFNIKCCYICEFYTQCILQNIECLNTETGEKQLFHSIYNSQVQYLDRFKLATHCNNYNPRRYLIQMYLTRTSRVISWEWEKTD